MNEPDDPRPAAPSVPDPESLGNVPTTTESSTPRNDPTSLVPGVVLLDRYRLEKIIGRGGMGQVYLAFDLSLHRVVAVKFIRPRDPELRDRSLGEERLREAFTREARIGANLTHPGIATVFDFGFHEQEPFIVFEYIDGETLADTIRRQGRLPLDDVQLILAPLAQALQAAHARQVVHRDLKPANIRSTAQGHYKILDLGLAREFWQTANWNFAGTPRYASPEQAAGLPCDGRTDQYALALIVFEMLTGRPVFTASTISELLRLHREQTPPSVREFQTELPQAVDFALQRALAKDPNQRFASCEEFAAALGCRFLTVASTQPNLVRLASVGAMKGLWSSARIKATQRSHRIHLALANDSLWVLYRGELKHWSLRDVELEQTSTGSRWLCLCIEGKVQAFRFDRAPECEEWCSEIQVLKGSLPESRDDAESARPAASVDPVVLLPRQPPIRCQTLGLVDCTHERRGLAETGLKIRAALLGADAVVDVQEERLSGFQKTTWRRSGTAIRAVDSNGRAEMLARWFQGQCRTVAAGLVLVVLLRLVLNFVTAVILFLLSRASASMPSLLQFPGANELAAGGTASLMASGIAIVLIHLWPLVLAAWLRLALIPQLLRPAAAGVLALMLLPLTILLVLLFRSLWWGEPLSLFTLLAPLDPINLGLTLFALFLFQRSWRIHHEYRVALGNRQEPTRGRQFLAATTWTGTAVFAVVVLAFAVLSGFSFAGPNGQSPLGFAPVVRDARLIQAANLVNGAVSRLQTDPAGAEKDLQTAQAIYQGIEPNHPQADLVRHDKGSCLLNLAVAERLTGKSKQAETDLRAALEQFRSLDGSWQSRSMTQRNIGLAHFHLGHLEVTSGRYGDCITDCRQSLAAVEGLDATNENLLCRANCWQNIGVSLSELKRFAEAIPEFRRGLEVYQTLGEPMKSNPQVQLEWAGCRLGLALTLIHENQVAEARPQLVGVIQQLEELSKRNPGNPQIQFRLALARQQLARLR